MLRQLEKGCGQFEYCFLASDEITNAKDTAQLFIFFFCGTDGNFTVTQEMTELCSIHHLEGAIEKLKLPWQTFAGVSTNKALAMKP